MSKNNEEDVRLVTLKRKNVGKHSSMADGSAKEPGQHFFATDYFDMMTVVKKSMSDDFTEIMGVCQTEETEHDEVSVQSFVLYDGSGENRGTNPFDVDSEKKKEAPFLSVIQIHITPEVLVHLNLKEGEEPADIFAGDIQQIVEDYQRVSGEKEYFTCAVYQMLSAGDFAVVVRSKQAKDAFAVSTRIRKRTVNIQDGSASLVLYKTYTLFTIDGCIIEVFSDENEGDETQKGQFVLRGTYSNLYWSRKNAVIAQIARNGWDNSEIFGLNGRYDFSVRLDAEEFRDIFPRLKNYKFPGQSKNMKPLNENCADKVKYLCFLMENNYVSYMNERYLLDADDIQDTEERSISSIPIVRRADERFLDEKISGGCKAIDRKYQQMRKEIGNIKGYRKNMGYYMSLLGKMIWLCQTINISSDTRIYAVVLLEQLDTVLASLNVYCQLLRIGRDKAGDVAEDAAILDLMNDYLRVSVYTLDCYANYIRNNNLQTVQTPNYNIESKVSMEKILIGYSQFLKQFIEAYLQDRKDEEKGTVLNTYLPIVVPDLQAKEVSVEVMFQEGNGSIWKEEEKIRNDAGKNGKKYLLVITTPTLYELNNTQNLSISLFHEIAHQFRYESREERNDTLVKYILGRECGRIAQSIMDTVDKETDRHTCDSIYKQLRGSLKKNFLDCFFKADGKMNYKFREESLKSFLRSLKDEFKAILRERNTRQQIDRLFRRVIIKVREYINAEDRLAAKALRYLDSLKAQWIEALIRRKGEDEVRRLEAELANCAFAVVYYCLAEKSGIEELDQGEIEEWCQKEQDWNELYNGCIAKNELRDAHSYFADWIYRYGAEDMVLEENTVRETALERSFRELCGIWREQTAALQEKSDTLEDDVLIQWAETGRYLGIDWEQEENKKRFESIVLKSMNKIADAVAQDIERAVLYYREETADIFMSRVLRLSPFGYLNILAENLPNNEEILEKYKERIIYVICILYCTVKTEKGCEISREKVWDVCTQVMRKICADISDILEEHCAQDSPFEDLRKLAAEEDSFAWKYGNIRCWENIENITEYLVNLNKYLAGALNSERREADEKEKKESIRRAERYITRYITIVRMIQAIFESADEHIGKLDTYAELREDMFRGRERIGKFRDNMDEDENIWIKKIIQYCNALKEMLESPYKIGEKDRKQEFNRLSIDFFLSMYYLNKMNCVQVLKEEGYENTDV